MPTEKNILIVGGAGFIGSHMVYYLKKMGYTPIVLDNFSTGHRNAVQDVECIEGDIADTHLLDQIFSKHTISAVMHFASLIQVGESVHEPGKYYANNVAATIHLLNAMLKWKIQYFIFSSSAAVYGEPQYTPIDEQHPLLPINPYGRSKWIIEKILEDFARAYDFHYAALRYFNAAGRDPETTLKECHEPESHLIPLILKAIEKKQPITIYGQDYSTPDGTCIRDYVHVSDLCSAHLLALNTLIKTQQSFSCNLGTGEGYSVQQVIDTARQVTGCPIEVKIGPRRDGDPAVLVADPTFAMHKLNWQPVCSDLSTIIQHVWQGVAEAVPVCNYRGV